MALITRFFQVPEQSFFPLGPRGTGRSAWLRAALAGAPAARTVVIGEIQLRIPPIPITPSRDSVVRARSPHRVPASLAQASRAAQRIRSVKTEV